MSGARKTEHRIEPDSGWLLNRSTGATEPFDGIRLLWRLEGERRWRRLVLVPDPEQGQTVESLTAEAPAIVARLAELASVPS